MAKTFSPGIMQNIEIGLKIFTFIFSLDLYTIEENDFVQINQR